MNTVIKTKLLPLFIAAGFYSVPVLIAQANDIPDRGPIPFSSYDMNNDGSVSEQEFNTIRDKRKEQRASEGRPINNWAKTFADFDANSDGKLNSDELTLGQRAQGKRRQAMGAGNGVRTGKGMGNRSFQSLDLNNDGCINAAEFAQAKSKGQRSRSNGNRPIFANYDANGDGYINEQELADGRANRIRERVSQGYQMKNLPNAPTFTEIDANSDGKIDSNEFSSHQRQR